MLNALLLARRTAGEAVTLQTLAVEGGMAPPTPFQQHRRSPADPAGWVALLSQPTMTPRPMPLTLTLMPQLS